MAPIQVVSTRALTSYTRRPLTDWNLRLEDLQTDFAPLAKRLQLDSSVHQSLCKISSSRSQGVRPDGDWSRRLVGLEECKGLDIVSWLG